jgi:uncharacterized membrane protein
MQTSDIDWEFAAHWVIATLVGWIVGMFAAIVLSELVVNLVYPNETNLIVGMCVGGAVGFWQKIGVRRWVPLAVRWVWGSAIGIGIPFVVMVFLDEFAPDTSESLAYPLIFLGGILCGVLQVPALRPRSFNANWWILASAVCWSLAWFVSRLDGIAGYLAGGIVLGVLSSAAFVWLGNVPKKSTGV